MAVAGQQAHLAAVEPCQNAVAIELDLVEPVATSRRLVDQRGQLRLGLGREVRLACTLDLTGIDLDGAGLAATVRALAPDLR